MLLYTWLRRVRENRLPGISMLAEPAAGIVPVRIEAPNPPASSATAAASLAPRRRTTDLVEMTLTKGRSLKADDGSFPSALARLIGLLVDGAKIMAHALLRARRGKTAA